MSKSFQSVPSLPIDKASVAGYLHN